jgi:hypothetical protein
MRACALLLILCGCGIDEAGQVTPTGDASGDVIDVTDGGGPDVQKEAGPPQSCSLDAGACVASLPAGWDLVAYDPANEGVCPSNYTSAPVVANVAEQPGACDCGCTVTKAPACDVGTLQRFVSSDTTCSTTGVSLNVNGPACTAYPSTVLLSHSKSSPFAPSGGTCTGDPVANKGVFSQNRGITCGVPAACQEQFCGGDIPGGFEPCIQKSGQQTCPAFSFTCSACTCDVNGPSTCTNASLDIFSDGQCATKLVTLPVDGNCDVDSAQGQTPGAFEYHATLGQACNATGPKTVSNVQLVNARTICCK